MRPATCATVVRGHALVLLSLPSSPCVIVAVRSSPRGGGDSCVELAAHWTKGESAQARLQLGCHWIAAKVGTRVGVGEGRW